MRVTRYLWISNLPARATEQDIRDVLQSHGKIQSVRIHADDGNYGAVVAFVDTKSATRAIESVVKLKKVQLSLQYCESSGNPGNNSLDQLSASLESVQTSNNASIPQFDDNGSSHKSRSSAMTDSGSTMHGSDKKEKSHNRLKHSSTPRTSEKETDLNMDVTSPRYSNEHRGLKISHLPLRSSDTNLREGLFHEYKKHGKITSVIVRGQEEDRICIITFRRSEDAEKALALSQGKVFFGTPITVTPHEGLEAEDPDLCPPEHALDEYHPKATKTLFVGNLCSSTITQDELRRTFRIYGEIIEIDIKVQANQPGTSYAFVQYGDIKSVVRALHDQESIRVNGKPVKLGFGKSQPTNVVWLDNLAPTINEAYLSRQFGRYGHLTHVILDRKSLRALLYFDAVEMAQRALNETRNRAIIGRKVQIDYAGYECQVAFMRKLTNYEKIGQVYENYKEHLQEFLALWPSYGGVLPILGDRPRYFNETHRDNTSFQGENPKFSHRKFNNFRHTSPERSQKQDISNRVKGSVSGSPRRVHQSSFTSTDRRRTFTMDPLEALRCSPQPVGWSTSNCSRSTGKLSDIMNQSVSEELRAGSILHRRRGPKASPGNSDTSHKSSVRRTSHNDLRSKHCDIMGSTVRGRSHLLEETDDISSGSFSSGFAADESPLDASPTKPQSSGSAEGTDSDSKALLHINRGYSSLGSKKHNNDPNKFQSKGSVRHEVTNLDDLHSASTRKHYKYKNSLSPCPNAQSSRSSVGRSQKSVQRSNLNSLHNHHNRGKADESVDKRLIAARPHGHRPTCSRSSVFNEGDSDAVKDKHIRSSVDADYATVKHSASNSSPSENSFKRTEPTYPTSRPCDAASVSTLPISTVATKSHDTLTKLELERAKLLRELSLLNDEVIGSGKNKSSASSFHPEIRTGQKRISCPTAAAEVPSPKLKRFDSTSKIDDQIRSPTGISNRTPILTSPTTIQKLSHSTEFRMNRVSTPLSFVTSPHPLTQTSVANQHLYFNTPQFSNSSGHNDPDSPPIINHISSPYARFMNHNNNKSISIPPSKLLPVDSVHTPIQSSLSHPSHQSSLTASSPRLIVPPEPTSPLSNISPPHSPNFVSNSSACSSSKLHPVNYNLNQHPLSGNRDPRLALHGQNMCDIPPPPPETFKLPLWVDTSTRTDTSPPANHHTIPLIPKCSLVETTKMELPSLHCEAESETSLTQDSSICSLDERIRLLDVQLMKSEKARPVVDYSKFRIRRKVEPSTTVTPSTFSTNINLDVPSTVTSSHSPNLGASSYTASRTEFTSPDSVNPSINSVPPINNLNANSSASGSLLTVPTSLSLIKPADTSEFVKSMLSATKSPSTTCVDAIVSSAVDQIGVSSRLLSPSPSNVDPFVNRLPRESILKNTHSIGVVTPAASAFGSRSNSMASRFHIPSGNLEHGSLSGAQPVGVATRLLQNQPLLSSDLERSPVTSQYLSHFKPSSRKESDSSDSLSAKLVDISNKVSPHTDLEKLDKKISRSKSPEECPNSHLYNAVRTSTKCSVASTRNNILTSSSRDLSNRIKPKQTESVTISATSCSVVKPIKRSTLDNSVFEPWKPTISKGDKMKKSLPSDTKQVSSEVLTPSQINQIEKDKTQKFQAKLHKNSKKKIGLDQECDSGVILKQKSTDCLKSTKPVPGNSALRTRDKGSRKSPPKKRKRVDNRKKISDSEESDWEPSLNDDLPDITSEPMGTDSSGEHRYESMYDKIKRRTSKNITKNDSKSKPDSMMQLVKARNKQPKGLPKKITHRSPIDSDTDECLSEDSTCPEKCTGKTSSPEHSQKVGRQRAYPKSSVNPPSTSPSKRKKQAVFSSLRALATSDLTSNTRRKKGKKSREFVVSTLTTGHVKQRSKSGVLANMDERNIKNSAKRAKNNKPANTRVHTNGRQTLSVDYTKSENSRQNPGLSSQNPKHKQNPTASVHNNDTKPFSNTRRNLVHRVFASTDSSSLSSSVCSDASDDERFEGDGSSTKQQIDPTCNQSNQSSRSRSPSSTPCISRSCSPDDLGADAAVRHTFGALTTPFNTITQEPKPDPNSRIISCSDSSEEKTHGNLSPEQTTCDSKPTPPTLPMTDSSLSAEHQSGKFCARDPAEWNIFTSLAKQSTPKHEDHRLKHEETSSSSTFDPVKVNAIQSSNCECESLGKLPSDIDDDLPSLEKHDEDEINKSDGCSLLLNDSSNLNHNLNEYIDDDLPPPVVPALGPPLGLAEGVMETALDSNSVIIEEVVYDGLEVSVSEADANIPLVSSKVETTPTVTKIDDTADDSQLPETPEVVAESPASQHDASSEIHTELSCVKCDISSESFAKETPVSSVAALSLHSTVLTPLAMLATSSTELTKSGQPILVTIPGSATTGQYNPSNIALISKLDCPTSQPMSHSSHVQNPVPQRHITFILPAPKVSYTAPLQQSPAVIANSTVATTVSEVKDALPVTDTSSTPLCSSGQGSSVCHTQPNTHTVFSSAVRHLPGINTQNDSPCTTTQPISPSPIQSLGSTSDQSDIASYVQRVIERVKQEKDEETLHQREKTKRTKKSLSISAPFISTATSLNSHALATTLGSTVVTCVAPLPLIAPLPSTTLASSGLKHLTQPHCNKIDTSTVAMGSLNDATTGIKVPAGIHSTEMKFYGTDDTGTSRSFDSNLESNSRNSISFPHSSSELVDKDSTQTDDTETNLVIDDCGLKDSIDEVIDAVLSGHFDEKEYTQKLMKGTFLSSHIRGPNFVSPPLVPQSDSLVLPEQLDNSSDQFQQGDSKVSVASNLPGQHPSGPATSVGAVIKNPSDYLTNTSNPSPGVLTPMHVLTFVATCVAPSTPQMLCNPAIVSPTMSNQTNCTISGQNIQTSTGVVSSSTSNIPDSMVDRTSVGYVPTSDSVDMIPTSGCNRIEHFAHLASNSLTYFYSFLAQRRLSPSISPSISGDSVTPRTPENLTVPLCVPAKVQAPLKGLSLPDVSVGSSTADYLATMAAMAAMATPSSIGNTTNSEAPIFNQSNCTPSFSEARQALKEVSWNDHLLTQDHPPIWYGRLSLKNEDVTVRMHYINGNQEVLKSCMSVIAEQQASLNNPIGQGNMDTSYGSCLSTDFSLPHPLKIVQRMRLEPSQLEGVQRKLRQANDFCMCLTLAAAPPLTSETGLINEQTRMGKILCDGFIKYMQDKCAAGIINVLHPCTQQNLFVIHIFPPCEFSRCQLQNCAPTLFHSLTQSAIPYVLTVITTV